MTEPDDSGVDVAQCLARSFELAAVSDSSRLDLELLLALALGQDRTWLYTWPEKTLTQNQLQTFEEALARRLKGEPLAHITGRREFWSLSLRVNASTLIPRPDTELLVMETLARFAGDAPDTRRQVLDLGTGTGAVALALASERPGWQLRGLEVAPEALALAELNRHDLGLDNAEFLHSDWFAGLTDGRRYHAIASNPPYIAPDDPHLIRGDVRFEPRSALVAQECGLADIVHIAKHARDYLAPGGWLLLEHGWDQGAAVRQLLEEADYCECETKMDFAGQERVTYGRTAGETKRMNDGQLLRYSRQIMLSDVDIEGQEKLLDARVLILGLGGLGAPAAMYLAAAGVGQLMLADFDAVDLTNLQRQIVHTTDRVGQPKVASAAETLRQLNPEVRVTCIEERLEGEVLRRQLEDVDLVLDCTDNFATRFDLNAACLVTRTPLVSGAAIRMEGQVAVFDSRRSDSPCYRCLYHTVGDEDLSCAASGVLAPLVGVIGAMQAVEAIKMLVGFGTDLAGRLLLFDAREAQWRELKLARDPECPACSGESR